MKYSNALKYAHELCIFGLKNRLSDRDTLSEMNRMLDCGISGFIFFRRNMQSTHDIQSLKRFSEAKSEPFFTMADQEGGRSTQLPEDSFRGLNQMAYSATNSKSLIEKSGKFMAFDLLEHGINTILGPVIDVNSEYDNPIIGIRSFSGDEKKVFEYASEYCKGLKSQGILTVLKHFPGHGPVFTDSHKSLPECFISKRELFEVHISPFRKLVKQGCADMIMSAHIRFPETDNMPSSLSAVFLDEILRKEIGFEGIAITDCLEMKAITDNFSMADAAVLAIKNGNDLVLISHTEELQKKALKALAREIYEGGIPEKELKAKLERIARKKSEIFKKPVGTEEFSEREKEDFEKQLAKESIFIKHRNPKAMDTKRQTDIIAVTGKNFGSASVERFIDDFSKMLSGISPVNIVKLDFEHLYEYESRYIESEFRNCILINDSRGILQSEKTVEFFRENLKNFAYRILISVSDPYDYLLTDGYDEYYALFGCAKYSAAELLNLILNHTESASVFPLRHNTSSA